MAIETGFPCFPIFKESEGGGGVLISGGGLMFDIFAYGIGAYSGRVLISEGHLLRHVHSFEEYNI